jgi:hypothetical protein
LEKGLVLQQDSSAFGTSVVLPRDNEPVTAPIRRYFSSTTIRSRNRFWERRLALAALIVMVASFASSASASPRKIIFDTDPGTDDAMALMLALNSPELDVRAITVVPGNTTAKQGLENALRMVSLAGRCDIPVAGGAQHPLFQKINHRRVLARQEWLGQYRIAAQQVQGRCALWPRPDH